MSGLRDGPLVINLVNLMNDRMVYIIGLSNPANSLLRLYIYGNRLVDCVCYLVPHIPGPSTFIPTKANKKMVL